MKNRVNSGELQTGQPRAKLGDVCINVRVEDVLKILMAAGRSQRSAKNALVVDSRGGKDIGITRTDLIRMKLYAKRLSKMYSSVNVAIKT